MIVVSGTITIDPTKDDLAVEKTAALVRETLKEPGCRSYGFYTTPGQPGVWRVFEEWEDQAALDAHFATPHMAAFMGAAGELGITATDIWKYEVSGTSKLM